MVPLQPTAGLCCGALLLLLTSCAGQEPDGTGPAPVENPESRSIEEPRIHNAKDGGTNATRIEVTESDLSFDPERCIRGKAGFAWGLGSVQVNVLGREGGFCIFHFTDEVEGGYRVYRCRAPVNGPPVKIYVANGGIETSFSREEAKIIRQGSVHFDKPVPRKPQAVPNSDYVNSIIADPIEGKGALAKTGSRVMIRYTPYADEFFDTKLVGIEENRPLEFTLGGGNVGAGLEAAVQGMKAGGKRRVLILEDVASRIRQDLGGLQPHTQLAIEIDLVKVQ